jgi:CCR4-NOT transcriptional regulation complex NOT5 subunit
LIDVNDIFYGNKYLITDYKELYEKMQKKWAAQEALITALKKEIQKLKG